MRDLAEIKAANRKAVKKGIVRDETPRYNVFLGHHKIKKNVTIAECADIRGIQAQCRFVRA